MRIATWNVNSARARMPRLAEWLADRRPDVACLQEIKCRDEEFPREPIEDLGYRVETFGQRTYNGVAILSRAPLEDVRRGLPGDDDDAERRVIAGTVGDLRVVNVYVVNGQSVGAPAYRRKLAWMGRLRDWLADELASRERLLVAGDFNVTFDDRDVHDPERWRERILCSTPERDALAAITDCGLIDAFRAFEPAGGHYTWWDFRTRGFQRGHGLRIDHVLVTPPVLATCTGVQIDVAERATPRPSDHAPVILTRR